MSKETKSDTSVATKEDKFTVFVPFGGQDEIKLSVTMVQNLICEPTKQGHKCSERDAYKFIAMCLAKRLNPFEGDAFLVGYDTQDGPKFSLITAHQAFLKRAELNKEYDGMKSGIIVLRDKDKMLDLEGDFHLDSDVLLGGWASVFFKNRQHFMHKRVKLGRFNTGKSIWAKDPAGMICKCAEADALRSSFPTMLGGLYMKEEIEVEPREEKLKKPIFGKQQPQLEAEVVRNSEQPPPTPLSDLRALMATDGIEESKLLMFMAEIGLCDKGVLLEELAQNGDECIEQAIKNWEDISRKIKEVKK